jgi:hypothetical protein
VSLVSRVHVRRVGGKFCGAGVDPLVHRAHTQGVAAGAHGGVRCLELLGQAAVRKAFLLQGTQRGCVNAVKCGADGGLRQALNFEFDFDDLLNLHQKPFVNLGDVMHLVQAPAGGKGITHVPDAVGPGLAELFLKQFAVLRLFVHAIHADFQAAQRFLERLLKGAAHRHHLTHTLHLGGQAAVGSRKFLKCETRNLGDHIVDAGFKRCRRGAPGDLVLEFIQGIAHRQLGRHLGNRETRGFGRQRAGAG